MYSLRIALSVLILLAATYLTSAKAIDACSETREGFDKANCYLDNNGIDEYFEYVKLYYSEVKGEEDKFDPALGFRFMESVARYERFEHTELATELYFWGLQADEVYPFQKWVEREVKYLSALLSPENKAEFYDLLDRNDPAIYDKIGHFWKTRDVVISNDKNERLLEHWERILFSKKNFTINDVTVYGTDERGIIYIRFGEPNKIRRGQFGSSRAELRSKLYDLQSRGFLSQSGSALHTIQQEILTSVIPAEYELWHYNDISERDNEYIFFLFGRKEGSGSFGLRKSVEEFIPQEVFSRALGNRSRGNDIRIGNFLQFIYYSDLASSHMFFGNQLIAYDRAWRDALEGRRINAGFLRNNISREKAQKATENVYNAAPIDISMYERRLSNLVMDVSEYRFLDEEGTPQLFYIVSSSPKQLLNDYDFIVNNQREISGNRSIDIHLRQGIFHYDRDYEELGKDFDQISQSTDGVAQNSLSSHNISLHDSLDNYSVAFAELYYSLKGNENNPAAWSLIGVNKDDVKRIPTLDYETGELVISDLILGNPANDMIDIRGKEIGILGKSNKIKQGDNFQIYFEVYHFQDNSPDKTVYEVEYMIKSTKKSWWPFSSSTEQSLAWETSTEDWFDSQFFEVETIERRPGNYELHIIVKENETGRKASRSIEFEIIE